jgi:Rrf2 family protein
MKMTRASQYAIHAMVCMAARKLNSPVASNVIAHDRHVPERFLLKVLKPLASARMLQSIKGPHGGYRLAKAAKDITLLEIIEAVDGPVRGQASFASDSTDAGLNKRLDKVCEQAADTLRHELGKVRLADLVGKGK